MINAISAEYVPATFMLAGMVSAYETGLEPNVDGRYTRQCFDMKVRIINMIKNHDDLSDSGKMQLMSEYGPKLMAVLQYCVGHIDDIAEYIHDFWSAGAMQKNKRRGQITSVANREHSLIKPLSEFTPEELAKEHLLAIGDVRGFIHDLERSGCSTKLPADVNREELLRHIGSDGGMVMKLACMLAHDQEFILRASGIIHDNWRIVTNQVRTGLVSDTRVGKALHELSDADREVTTNNVYNDWCAVIAFLEQFS